MRKKSLNIEASKFYGTTQITMLRENILSIIFVEINGEISRTSTNFVIYHTDNEGQSECFAVGRYEDEWCLQEEAWQLQQREVVLKTRQLPVLSPLPI